MAASLDPLPPAEEDDLRRAQRKELLQRGLIVTIVAILLVILGAVVWLAVSIRATQLEGTPVGKKLLASSEAVLDCTQTQGVCYKRNQANTAEAVSQLNDYQLRIVVIAAACSAGIEPALPVRTKETLIQACVTKRLALAAAKK